jgi:hypothetical protein
MEFSRVCDSIKWNSVASEFGQLPRKNLVQLWDAHMNNEAYQVFVLHVSNQAKIISYQKLLESSLLLRAKEMLEEDHQRLAAYERQLLGVVV